MRKFDLGRNVNIERSDNDDWNAIMGKEIFAGFDKKELYILCMALGYKMGIQRPLKERYPTINIPSIDNGQRFLFASLGISVQGESALSNVSQIKAMTEKYAKGGFKILQSILQGSHDDMVVATDLYEKIIEHGNLG